MKKRLISLALTLALCLGLTVPAVAVDTSGLDANGAKAYLEVLNKQIAAYGIITETYAPSGIMYTALEDMNADGTPELIMFAGKKSSGGDILVWTLRNGSVVQTVNAIDEIDYSGNIVYTSVSLARKPGETAVCVRIDVRQYNTDGSSGLYPEEFRIYHFDGTKETLTFDEWDMELDNEDFGGDGQDVGYWYGDQGVSTYAVQSALTAKAVSVPSGGFTDVKAGAYYADAVKWAVERKITSGTSATTFSPNATCTNAQILTFLWRANGSPEPVAANPFTGIKTTDYYYKAALWAAEKNLVSGSAFDANTDCTRAVAVEYLWKAAGSPAASSMTSFTDVPANAGYARAVAWAVENGITSGTGGGNFSPNSTCTRGQIVTFLYRAMGQ